MFRKIFTTSLCMVVLLSSSQFVTAQARQNEAEIMCKVTIVEEGKIKVLMVPRSKVSDYHNNSNLVGINCRNDVERNLPVDSPEPRNKSSK